MGLLDGNLDDPQKQMLMALAAGLLQGSGRTNKNFGADLGNAIPQGLMALNNGRALKSRELDAEQQRQMHAMQLEQLRAQTEQQQRMSGLAQKFQQPGMPQMQPTDQETPSGPPGPGRMDWQGYSNALSSTPGINPMAALDVQAKIAALNQKERVKAGPGETLGTYHNGKFVPDFTAPDKPPAGFTRGPNGNLVPDAGWLDAQIKLRKAGAPSVTVDNRQENEFNKKIGAEFAQNYNDILKSGAASQTKLRDIQRFDALISQVPTGKLEPVKAEVGKLAASLGVKVDMEKLGFQEGLESLSNQFALTLRNPSNGAGMPGAMSDKDREFLVSMVPGLAKTPAGNKIIIEAFRRTAQREAEVAALAREYKKRTGKFDEGFYDVLAEKFGGKDLLGDLMVQAGPAVGGVMRFDRNGNQL